MVYLNKSTNPQQVSIPKETEGSGSLRLVFTVGIEREIVSLDVEDSKLSDKYYFIEVTLPAGIDYGEYTYRLMDEDDAVLSIGLLIVGEYDRPYEYEKTITYKQYEQ